MKPIIVTLIWSSLLIVQSYGTHDRADKPLVGSLWCLSASLGASYGESATPLTERSPGSDWRK